MQSRKRGKITEEEEGGSELFLSRK